MTRSLASHGAACEEVIRGCDPSSERANSRRITDRPRGTVTIRCICENVTPCRCLIPPFTACIILPDPRLDGPVIPIELGCPEYVFRKSSFQARHAISDGNLARVANLIWGIADDVSRDVYVRGKYRDMILPMTVIRRLDAVLEEKKQQVLDMNNRLDDSGITNHDAALRQAAD